ncbi:MAG: hypothetical protein K8W52_33605 [Deltaproteobacteria bacterium]|nr:hypothetical protein [Deltaproteobacteria bacterium]
MPAPRPLCLAVVGVIAPWVVACNDGPQPRAGSAAPAAPAAPSTRPTAPAPAPLTTVRDPLGQVVAEVRLDGDGARCGVRVDQVALEVVRDGAATTASPGTAGAALRLEPGPAGDVITSDGARSARIYRDPARPGHVDILDNDGVAMVRIAIDGDGATLVDASRAAVARARKDGGRIVVDDPDGRALAYVSGDDLEVAALLVASAVPPDLRGLAACDRLLTPAVPPAGTP